MAIFLLYKNNIIKINKINKINKIIYQSLERVVKHPSPIFATIRDTGS